MIVPDLALLLAKVSALLVVVLILAHILRRASAGHRHGLWSLAFGALLALAPLAALLPALHIPLPSWSGELPASIAATTGALLNTDAVASTSQIRTSVVESRANAIGESTTIAIPFQTVALAMWLTGVMASLTAFAVSLHRVRGLGTSSVPLENPDWRAACTRIGTRLGITRRVRVVASPDVAVPMAGGVFQPTVVVPMDATTWSSEQREIVLSHEIAHLAHGDPIRQFGARIAVALYWFHPLVWLAVDKATAACEEACDEAVLRLGVRPSTYARVLLGFAGSPPVRFASAALPMARQSTLENRLMAILDNSARPAMRGRILFPFATFVALTFTVAAATPVRSAVELTPPPRVERPRADIVPVSVVDTKTPIIAAVQQVQQRAGDCEREGTGSRSFRGTTSTTRRGGTNITTQQIGSDRNTHIIVTSFGELRVCAVAVEVPESRDNNPPSRWGARARRVTLETQQDGDVRTMQIVGGDLSYSVNGRTRDVDAAALAWRDALFSVLDRTWELSMLRGQVASLRGEIASVEGQRASLQGEIASLRGQVASMQGEIASARGGEQSLRGEIASIRGHEASLRGAIASERGAISSLEATRRYEDAGERARIESRVRRHEDRIAEIEREIRDYDTERRVREVERRIERLDTDRGTEAIERRIRDFDVERRVADVNRRIERLDVQGRVRSIERDIDGLNYERRSRALEADVDDAVARLRSVLRR